MVSDHNPYEAAFETTHEDDEETQTPYRLGSLYEEDSFGLLDNEFSNSPLLSSQKAATNPPPRVPAKASTGFNCLDLLICFAEYKVYKRIDTELPFASSNLKFAFWLHWIGILAVCINCYAMSSLFLGGGPDSGIGKDSIPSFWGFLMSIVYLFVVSFGQYFGWVSPFFYNTKAGYEASWTWFNLFFTLSFGLSIFLFLGLPATGSVGIIALLQIRNWKPSFVVTTVLSIIFTVLQGLNVLGHLFLYSRSKQTGHGTDI